jgi:hypothetical protein
MISGFFAVPRGYAIQSNSSEGPCLFSTFCAWNDIKRNRVNVNKKLHWRTFFKTGIVTSMYVYLMRLFIFIHTYVKFKKNVSLRTVPELLRTLYSAQSCDFRHLWIFMAKFIFFFNECFFEIFFPGLIFDIFFGPRVLKPFVLTQNFASSFHLLVFKSLFLFLPLQRSSVPTRVHRYVGMFKGVWGKKQKWRKR